MSQPRIDGKSGQVSPADAEALERIQSYSGGELTRVQTRAEKWITGLTALTGVLTTAVVLKGPEGFTELAASREILGLSVDPRQVVVALMFVGGGAVAVGIWNAYSAAHGSPLDHDGLSDFSDSNIPAAGAAGAWMRAVRATEKSATAALQRAAIFTIIGITLLAAAVILAWTTPTTSSTSSTCIEIGGDVVEIEGAVPTVIEGSLAVVPCP